MVQVLTLLANSRNPHSHGEEIHSTSRIPGSAGQFASRVSVGLGQPLDNRTENLGGPGAAEAPGGITAANRQRADTSRGMRPPRATVSCYRHRCLHRSLERFLEKG